MADGRGAYELHSARPASRKFLVEFLVAVHTLRTASRGLSHSPGYRYRCAGTRDDVLGRKPAGLRLRNVPVDQVRVVEPWPVGNSIPLSRRGVAPQR